MLDQDMTDPVTPAPTPASTPAQDQKAGQWYGDAKYEGVVSAKGWKNAGDVLDSYQNLEKVSRTPIARTLVLPEKDDDAPGWDQVYNRMGRPEKPEMYKLEGFEPVAGQQDLVQGENGFLTAAHKAGISQRQASDLFKWYSGRLDADGTQTSEQIAEKHTAELDTLRGEWGNAFDGNTRVAKYAASQLGVSTSDLEQIENALGTKWLMTTFHKIGQSMTSEPGLAQSQDPIDGAGDRDGFGVTPAHAQAKIEELMSDRAFYRRYVEGGKPEMERISRLTEAAAGRAPAGRGRVSIR